MYPCFCQALHWPFRAAGQTHPDSVPYTGRTIRYCKRICQGLRRAAQAIVHAVNADCVLAVMDVRQAGKFRLVCDCSKPGDDTPAAAAVSAQLAV